MLLHSEPSSKPDQKTKFQVGFSRSRITDFIRFPPFADPVMRPGIHRYRFSFSTVWKSSSHLRLVSVVVQASARYSGGTPLRALRMKSPGRCCMNFWSPPANSRQTCHPNKIDAVKMHSRRLCPTRSCTVVQKAFSIS